MRTVLRSLVWLGVFGAGAAGAHDLAIQNVCGDVAPVASGELVRLTKQNFAIQATCLVEQQRGCGGGARNALLDDQAKADLQCRPQYCSERALNLPPGSLDGPVCRPTSCGVVDDAWHRATVMAWDDCAAQNAVPQITGPASYFQTDHHTAFHSSDSLSYRCVQCPVSQ